MSHKNNRIVNFKCVVTIRLLCYSYILCATLYYCKVNCYTEFVHLYYNTYVDHIPRKCCNDIIYHPLEVCDAELRSVRFKIRLPYANLSQCPNVFPRPQPHRKSCLECRHITLFRSITMLCGTDNIPQNIPHIKYDREEYSI